VKTTNSRSFRENISGKYSMKANVGSIIDVVEILSDSSIPKRYWSDLKRKLINEGLGIPPEKCAISN